MSNRVYKPITLSAIPQVASSTVPVAQRRVIGATRPVAVAEDRFIAVDRMIAERRIAEVFALVLTAGAHTAYTLTVEGSFDGVNFFALHYGVAQIAAVVTSAATGIALSGAAGLAGYVARVPGGFPFYRVGLAGDNVAADGTAVYGMGFSRDN